ncbi:hypothetical protein [Sinomicrobium weinanense]|uniref:Uncharacterized protein n=1 Tax=Sinomicrobium weinanense TaxID=2842200 RepID=A0A926JPI8_9FLAO|nr:hypothetical protein [Sinomicrobium weinanense]MBC9794871.1 hypothetical protein [Sinomicrobium weinanense]MBU3125642.1 hypothetical protein [Sinomicrobium weinanense]
MKNILLLIGLVFSTIGLMAFFLFEIRVLGYFILALGFLCCLTNLILQINKKEKIKS